jgi:L-asparaginase
MEILILITGGTLDKVHDTQTEGLVFETGALEGLGSGVISALAHGRCDHPRREILMQIDSLDMTDTHRAAVLQAVLSAPETRIVITHGTGTMAQTAQYLDGKVGEKTVILTGAMRPQSLGQSDAGFNLGGAVIAAQSLDYGVYGVMNGRIFEAQHLEKNTEAGRFDL